MSIDGFLSELFGPPPTTQADAREEAAARLMAPPAPTTFNDRFDGAAGLPPMQGADGPPMLTSNAALLGGGGAAAPPGDPMLGGEGGGPAPLPMPRPDVASILAGRAQMGGGPVPLPTPRPDAAGPGAPMQLGAPPAAPAAAPTDAKAKVLEALFGKRTQSAMAGGMAEGNPAFKLGAFMKGASGSLTGGLKSDKEDKTDEAEAEEKAQKQKNFERTQGGVETERLDKSKTSEALRKLYGVRGEAMLQNSAARVTQAGKKSWDQPARLRFKEAEQAIDRKIADLRKNRIDRYATPEEKKAAEADIQKDMAAERKRIYAGHGVDENGNDVGQPKGSNAQSPAAPGIEEDDENISNARIAVGKNPGARDAIRKRLIEGGYSEDEANSAVTLN